MRGLEANGDATRLDELDERVRDLLADALLHGEAARVQTHKPRQLRNPDDFWTGDIADMSDAMERKRWCSHSARKVIGPSMIWLCEPSTCGGRSFGNAVRSLESPS